MRHWLGVLLIGTSLGCVAKDATLVQIERALAPDGSCNFQVGNASTPYGSYDPAFDGTAYHLQLLLRNNMQQRSDNPQLMSDSPYNIRPRANDARIVGVEGCWFKYEGDVTKFATYRADNIVDCATKYPNQSASIPVTAQIDEGGLSEAVVGVDILTPAHLKQLFGDDFSATEIPELGEYPYRSIDPTGRYTGRAYSYAAQDPNDPNRSAAWGNYPTTRKVPVVVQLRAVVQLQSGARIFSGWFSYMIYICPRCVASACGDLLEIKCPICPYSLALCTTPTCTDDKSATIACAPTPIYSGYQPTFKDKCLPGEFFSIPDCDVAKVGCP